MERRLLQIAVALAASVPVVGGCLGVVFGPAVFGLHGSLGGDNHVRYLSGLLLGIGFAFWNCIPAIERRGELIRLLAVIVVTGGLARLAGDLALGDPGLMRLALIMELVVTPALAAWQWRIARLCGGIEDARAQRA
jgi:hypothetical protein